MDKLNKKYSVPEFDIEFPIHRKEFRREKLKIPSAAWYGVCMEEGCDRRLENQFLDGSMRSVVEYEYREDRMAFQKRFYDTTFVRAIDRYPYRVGVDEIRCDASKWSGSFRLNKFHEVKLVEQNVIKCFTVHEEVKPTCFIPNNVWRSLSTGGTGTVWLDYPTQQDALEAIHTFKGKAFKDGNISSIVYLRDNGPTAFRTCSSKIEKRRPYMIRKRKWTREVNVRGEDGVEIYVSGVCLLRTLPPIFVDVVKKLESIFALDNVFPTCSLPSKAYGLLKEGKTCFAFLKYPTLELAEKALRCFHMRPWIEIYADAQTEPDFLLYAQIKRNNKPEYVKTQQRETNWHAQSNDNYSTMSSLDRNENRGKHGEQASTHQHSADHSPYQRRSRSREIKPTSSTEHVDSKNWNKSNDEQYRDQANGHDRTSSSADRGRPVDAYAHHEQKPYQSRSPEYRSKYRGSEYDIKTEPGTIRHQEEYKNAQNEVDSPRRSYKRHHRDYSSSRDHKRSPGDHPHFKSRRYRSRERTPLRHHAHSRHRTSSHHDNLEDKTSLDNHLRQVDDASSPSMYRYKMEGPNASDAQGYAYRREKRRRDSNSTEKNSRHRSSSRGNYDHRRHEKTTEHMNVEYEENRVESSRYPESSSRYYSAESKQIGEFRQRSRSRSRSRPYHKDEKHFRHTKNYDRSRSRSPSRSEFANDEFAPSSEQASSWEVNSQQNEYNSRARHSPEQPKWGRWDDSSSNCKPERTSGYQVSAQKLLKVPRRDSISEEDGEIHEADSNVASDRKKSDPEAVVNSNLKSTKHENCDSSAKAMAKSIAPGEIKIESIAEKTMPSQNAPITESTNMTERSNSDTSKSKLDEIPEDKSRKSMDHMNKSAINTEKPNVQIAVGPEVKTHEPSDKVSCKYSNELAAKMEAVADDKHQSISKIDTTATTESTDTASFGSPNPVEKPTQCDPPMPSQDTLAANKRRSTRLQHEENEQLAIDNKSKRFKSGRVQDAKKLKSSKAVSKHEVCAVKSASTKKNTGNSDDMHHIKDQKTKITKSGPTLSGRKSKIDSLKTSPLKNSRRRSSRRPYRLEVSGLAYKPAKKGSKKERLEYLNSLVKELSVGDDKISIPPISDETWESMEKNPASTVIVECNDKESADATYLANNDEAKNVYGTVCFLKVVVK